MILKTSAIFAISARDLSIPLYSSLRKICTKKFRQVTGNFRFDPENLGNLISIGKIVTMTVNDERISAVTA